MIENVIVESIWREEIAAIICLVKRPVVAQALGAEHENAIIAQLVIFYDRERFECFTEANTVGDDAAAKSVQLIERANDAVMLELEQLFPDDRVADASGGFDDPILVQLLATLTEQMQKDERIRLERVVLRG